MKRATSVTAASLIGFGLFFGLVFGFHLAFSTSLAVALVVGGLTILFTGGAKKDQSKAVSPLVSVDADTRKEIEETVRAGKKLSSEMRQAAARLSQSDVRLEIEDLCKISDSMMDMLRKDPNDMRQVKQFITYYLEPTHKIIVKYGDIATARPMPADAISILERTEQSLKTIRTTFLQQKQKMLDNDVMDLDTEMKVFEQISGVNLNPTDPKATPGTSVKPDNRNVNLHG